MKASQSSDGDGETDCRCNAQALNVGCKIDQSAGISDNDVQKELDSNET